jgi:hypothetical protein
MKQTIGFSEFQDAFTSLRPQNFSLQGLGVLWDYLEQYEQDCGEEIELDVVALCCDFNEDGTNNIASDYRIDVEGLDADEITEAVREYLEDEGALVGEVEGGFVYRSH